MSVIVTNAVVTSSRRYGEADRLITLLTESHGRIGAIAKSSRKPKSRLRGASEPFVIARFELAEGKSLAIVRHAEILTANLPLRENWTRLQLAGHVAEIANRMSEEGVPDPVLYEIVARALFGLCRGDNSAVLNFKAGLIDHLGIFPELAGCVSCGKMRVRGQVHFDAQNHGFLCPDCAAEKQVYHPVPMKVLHIIHESRKGEDVGAEYDLEQMEKAEDLLTLMLQGFLQAGFKTVKAARHARKHENHDTKDVRNSVIEDFEP